MKLTVRASDQLDPRLATALEGYAAELRATARVPSVENLLWRAALRERLARAERAVRVGNQVRRAILTAGGLGIVIVAVISRRPLLEFFTAIQGGGVASGTSASLDLVLATVALLSASGLVLWLAELPGEKP